MKYANILLFLLLIGCAGTPIDHKLSPEIVRQMNEVYNPIIEKGFCVSEVGIHNLITGSFCDCPMPLCFEHEIVFHTHPFWEPRFLSGLDMEAWIKYHELYGNTLFGVMYGEGKYKIYEVTK